MKLAFERHGEAGGAPLLIAHGLFGSAKNWTSLAKRLGNTRPVIAVDMRNHGASPWDDGMTYEAMAADLAETIAAEAGGRADVLGHSMGGKAAMALALTAPERVSRLIVADIAPVAYEHRDHGRYVAAMRAVDLSGVTRRSQVDPMLAEVAPEPAIRAFLLQNLETGPEGARWRLNLAALEASMDALIGWPETYDGARFDGPTLFLRGGLSPYLADAHRLAVDAAFPDAAIGTVEGANHWLHAEKPNEFLAAVERFLAG